MNKEQFIKKYCERSDITREFFDENLVALRCDCDAENCKRWAAVRKDKDTIRIHNQLYGPR